MCSFLIKFLIMLFFSKIYCKGGGGEPCRSQNNLEASSTNAAKARC